MDITHDGTPQTTPESKPHTSRDTWMRGLYMLLIMIAGGIAQSLLGLIAVVQFIWLLVSGAPNEFLKRFGVSLSKWAAEVVQFQTCATEDKPFPFKAWPSAD